MQAITAAQMAELDRIMIEDYGIDVPIMMEHAAMALATVAAKMCKGSILILCGHGNNGGDGFAAARHLQNWGYTVTVAVAAAKNKLKPDPLKHANILEKMNIPIEYDCSSCDMDADVIMDALLGYNLRGNPEANYKALIEAANNSGKDILAVDVPSGLDATTGQAATPCIKAAATVALSMAKTGIIKEAAKSYVGKLFVSYMSVPDAVYEKVGVANPFKSGQLLLEVK